FENDFNKMYLNDSLRLYAEWETFIIKMIAYAETINISYVEEQLEEIERETITSEERDNRILIGQSFYLLQTIGELNNVLEAKRAKLAGFGLTLQPTPVFVGELNNITAAYVIVDDLLLSTPTALKAVDLCFKVIHALHTEYPVEAEQVWMLLQWGLYNIRTEYDKSYVSVNIILSDLLA
ncbi:hypothetical protein ILUMI_15937, partial [Ignelater luminosus]